MILNNVKELKGVMADCVNASLTSGTFPDCFKQANVVPLYKKKGPHRPNELPPSLSVKLTIQSSRKSHLHEDLQIHGG